MERDSESHEDINMGSSSGKRQPPPGVAVTMSPMQVHFQSLYRDVREALKSSAASPEEASAACLALKHFFREAAKQMVDDLDAAEFLDALEKLLREIEAKLCDERGAEDREEGRQLLQAALARMEDLREHYLDCKGCARVIGDTQADCATKAKYPPPSGPVWVRSAGDGVSSWSAAPGRTSSTEAFPSVLSAQGTGRCRIQKSASKSGAS